MSNFRVELSLIVVSILAGLLLAGVVALPRWIEDSRMVLEVDFVQAPQGETPVFKLRYERGRGLHSLRVTEPFAVETEDEERFRWVFDSRPIQSIEMGIAGWSGLLEVDSAALYTLSGDLIYAFDRESIRAEDGVNYPLENVPDGSYQRLVFPVERSGGIARNHQFTRQSWIATAAGFFLGLFAAWFVLQLCRTRPFRMSFLQQWRGVYPQTSDTKLPGRGVIYGSVVFLGLCVLLRSWGNFLYPSLFVEDAFHYFNHFYGAGVTFFDGILRDPNGYFNLFPNFVAWSLAWIDVRWVPGAYVAVAVAFSLFAAAFPLLTGWFRNRWIVFALPLVLGLSGLNHIFYYTTLTFQMYIVVLVLLVMLFRPAPGSWWSWGVRVLVGVILIFSGPYSVVAVPVGCLLLVFYRPSRQSWFWAAMVIAGLVFLETSAGMTRLQNLLEPTVVEQMAVVLVERVFFFGWGWVGWIPGAMVVGMLIFLLYALLWRCSDFRRIGTAFLAVVGLALAPLFLSVKFIHYPVPYDCHVLISQFFWLLFLLFAADCLARQYPRRKLLAPLLMSGFLLFVGVDQWKNPQKHFAPPNPDVLSFVEEVRKVEEMGLEQNNTFVVIEGRASMQDAFRPRVRVGSARDDAVRIPPEVLDD